MYPNNCVSKVVEYREEYVVEFAMLYIIVLSLPPYMRILYLMGTGGGGGSMFGYLFSDVAAKLCIMTSKL